MKSNEIEGLDVLSDVFSRIFGVDINLQDITEVEEDVKKEVNEKDDIEIDAFTSMRERFDLAEEKFFNLEKEYLSVETSKRYEHPVTNETSFESITELKSPDDNLKTIARRTVKETFFIDDSKFKVEESEVFKKEGNAYVSSSTQYENYRGELYKSETEVTVEFFDC